MTAPIASGWSDRRVGLAPTGKRRLFTAHADSGHWGQPSTGSRRKRGYLGAPRRPQIFSQRAGTLIKSSSADKLKKKHSITGRIEMDAAIVLANIRDLAVQFASERRERQQRRHLDSADFNRLCEAGFLLTGVPIEYGGIWEAAKCAQPRQFALTSALRVAF
jgi:hypothetical protein